MERTRLVGYGHLSSWALTRGMAIPFREISDPAKFRSGGDFDSGSPPRGPIVTRSDNGPGMPRFSLARVLLASCSAAAVIAFSTLPAFAASVLNSVRVDALPNGGALVSATFSGGPPTYHVVGMGTIETAVLFDGTALGPQLPPSIAGAGPIATVALAQNGTSTSLALHLTAAAPVSVRVAGNLVFINVVSRPSPDGLNLNPLPGPGAAPAPGEITEVVPLKYADVSEIAGILVSNSNVATNDTFVPQSTSLGTSSLSGSFGGVSGGSFGGQPAQAQAFGPGGAFGQNQGLAQRLNDNIAIDRRLNAIILTGTPDVLAPIKETIAKIDIPVQSVILETQIVELSDTAARNIGIDFSPDGTGAVAEAVNNGTTGVNIRTGAEAVSGVNLSANLYAQVQEGNAKIIAKPRILAQSGQEASILTGDAIPIVTNVVVAGAGAVSSQQVNYVNVGVNLQIQPRVSSDGYVTSHIYSEVSSVTQYVNGIPQISQRTASTLATVRDGEAFVIGGLLQDNEIRNLSKLPFLGDFPLIGQFFQHVNTSHTQTNLYVVVTPHIVAAPGVTPYTGPLAVPSSLPQLGPPSGPSAPTATGVPLTGPTNVAPAPAPTPTPAPSAAPSSAPKPGPTSSL
jgi:general secretion pathway protein D